MNHPYKLTRSGSVLVVVDVQDKLLWAMHERQAVLENAVRMVKIARIMEVPVIVTEQYPQGLGSTVARIAELIPEVKPWEKTVFDCFGAPGFADELEKHQAKTLVFVGIEAHICVQQTSLTALAHGYGVQVIADAAGSRLSLNKELGLAKIRQAGGIISSVEMATYEWLERADGQEFKAILPLIK